MRGPGAREPSVAVLTIEGITRRLGRVYFGWWIVVAGIIFQGLSGMVFMHSAGAYFVLLRDQFQWSGTVLSGAFSLSRIESGILGPLQGLLLDKVGPRAVARIGILLFALGFVFMSRMDSVLEFYGAFALMALGSGLAGFLTLTTTIVNWFERRRALAVGLATAGMGLGGLAAPGIAWALTTFGWRDTALFSGIAIALVGLPLTQLYRRTPEEYGYQIDGGAPRSPRGRAAQTSPQRRWGADVRAFTAREAMRTQAFWLISLGHASSLLVVSAMMVHLIPHLVQSLDFSVEEAAGVVAVLNVMMIVCQVMGGYVGDRFNKLRVAAVCMLLHSVALLILANATGAAMAYLAAGIHGMAWGLRGPQMTAVRAEFFGRTAFGTIMGFSNLIIMMGMVAGPLIAGILEDNRGDYRFAFTLLATMTALGSGFFAFTRRPAVPARHADVATTPS